VDADGAVRSPVRGLMRAAVRGQHLLVPARRGLRDRQRPTATETSDASRCRTPRGFRRSASRPASDTRNAAGSGAAPAGRMRRMQSISHDEPTGVVLTATV